MKKIRTIGLGRLLMFFFVIVCGLGVFVEGAASADPAGAALGTLSSPTSQPVATKGVQSVAFQSVMEEFQQGYRSYMRKVVGREHRGDIGEILVKPENLMRKLMVAAFQGGKTFDDVRRLTDGAVDWLEYPSQLFSGHLSREKPRGMESLQVQTVSADERPIVFYRTAKTASGGDLVVMQDALFVDYGDIFRRRSEPYAAVMLPGGAKVGSIRGYGDHFSADVLPSTLCLVLGVVECDWPVPAVVVMHGPDGSGNFLSLDVCIFDVDKGVWKRVPEDEFSGISTWEYESSEGLRVNIGDPDETRVDIKPVVDRAINTYRERPEIF